MAHGNSPLFTRIGSLMGRYAWLVVAFWILAAGGLNIAIPQIEKTVAEHSAPFLPQDIPSAHALKNMAKEFGVPVSSAVGNIVISRDSGLNVETDNYYKELVTRLLADKTDVAYLLDIYGSPLTREIAVSPNKKALTIMVVATGDVGSTQAHHSTVAIRKLINEIPKPVGVQTHYTGSSPTLADLFSSIDESLIIITAVSVVLITLLLLLAYRSFAAAFIPLITIGIALAISRPVISLLGQTQIFEVSNFTIALSTTMILGAGTDWAIFLLARYHDGRRQNLPSDHAVNFATGRTAGILVASAITIAAASAAMAFTEIGMFKTSGLPISLGIMLTLLVTLTLTPALLAIAGKRNLIEPKINTEERWQRRGAAIIRRRGPIAAMALTVLALLTLAVPTLKITFDESKMQIHPNDSTRGYDQVYKYFGSDTINPEFLVVHADHDLRNTNDLAALELIASSVTQLPFVRNVQSVTRPTGKPLVETAIGYQTGIVGSRLADANKQLIAAGPQLKLLASGAGQLRDGATDAAAKMPELVTGTNQIVAMANSLLDVMETAEKITAVASDNKLNVAGAMQQLSTAVQTIKVLMGTFLSYDSKTYQALRNLDTVFGPLLTNAPSRQCSSDARCLAARAAFFQLNKATNGRAKTVLTQLQGLAGVPVELVDRTRAVLPHLETGINQLTTLINQLGGRTPAQVRNDLARLSDGIGQLSSGMTQLATGLTAVKTGTDTATILTKKLSDGLTQATDYLSDLSRNTSAGPGAGFFLPPSGFADPRFVAGTQLLLSPNGKTARMLVHFNESPYSYHALNNVHRIAETARDATKGTVLDGAKIDSTGLASLSADTRSTMWKDFSIFAIVALIAVSLVLMALLRSVLAPLLLVGAVILSFGATAGITVIFWQHLLGIDVDWSVLPISFMALVAVGADYSMLFASRIREESAHGTMDEGIIRGFGATGGVITTAGIIFAVTMFALMSGTVLNLVQLGFTIGVGLIFDVTIVRTLLVPSVMSLLGKKVWWPAKA